MCVAYGIAQKILAPELGGYCELLPHSVVLVLNVHGKHWRVVGHLREGERKGGRRRRRRRRRRGGGGQREREEEEGKGGGGGGGGGGKRRT